MNTFTKDPSTHPANGSLTEERLIRVRDELQRNLEYGRDHFFADAVKAIEYLLALRKAPQLTQPAEMMPNYSQFLSDVMTAAGLLSHGKRDKALATRLADFCVAERMGMDAPCRSAMLQCADGNFPVIPDEKGSSLQLRNLIRQRHAEWSQSTFGDVGPVGPLKHLSKEALEAAAEPEDLSEWADMQFLLWDAQRRAGISDGEITAAMEEKLNVNMARQWPEPKDGEPRLHIKAAPQQEAE